VKEEIGFFELNELQKMALITSPLISKRKVFVPPLKLNNLDNN